MLHQKNSQAPHEGLSDNERLFRCTYESPLVGALTLISNESALLCCLFAENLNDLVQQPGGQNGSTSRRSPDKTAAARNLYRRSTPDKNNPVLVQARAWLDRYFANDARKPDKLPLAPIGTPFQQRVWRLLLEIPYGETVTYGDIAKALSNTSSRAVGGAVGRNPLGIIIPCHRVIGANGNVTGFTGGIHNKLALLAHEGIDLATLHIPR